MNAYRFGVIKHAIVVTGILCLAACSSTTTIKDGAPKFYVDETKIPNPVPRVEPLAKYGNMPYYNVFGKRYYTLNSYKGFEQVGIASWYGTKFHAQRTSSGEPYSMLTMSAAHKTLPLPCYVEVTNLQNHRKVIVRVNDRGPFSGNRIIDLSYVAAKKLDMLGHGTARVKIRAIDPGTYGRAIVVARSHPLSKRATLVASTSHKVYLQVGAFRKKSNAFNLRDKLSGLLKAPVDVINPSQNSSFYLVKVGPIHDLNFAKNLNAKLLNLGFKPRTFD